VFYVEGQESTSLTGRWFGECNEHVFGRQALFTFDLAMLRASAISIPRASVAAWRRLETRSPPNLNSRDEIPSSEAIAM